MAPKAEPSAPKTESSAPKAEPKARTPQPASEKKATARSPARTSPARSPTATRRTPQRPPAAAAVKKSKYELDMQREEKRQQQQHDKEQRSLARFDQAHNELEKIKREMKEKVHERKEIQDTLEHREKEEEHLQKEREKRLSEMRRRETKLDRDIAIRERQEQRYITRLRKLKSELQKYGGADLIDGMETGGEEGEVTEDMVKKERKATEALRGEVEQMERQRVDRERPVHPPHSFGKPSIPRHTSAAPHPGNVVRYISPTPMTVSGGSVLSSVEAAFLRPPVPAMSYPPTPGMAPSMAPSMGYPPAPAPAFPAPTSFMPPAAAQASPAVLYRGTLPSPSPVPPGMFRSVSSTVIGF